MLDPDSLYVRPLLISGSNLGDTIEVRTDTGLRSLTTKPKRHRLRIDPTSDHRSAGSTKCFGTPVAIRSGRKTAFYDGDWQDPNSLRFSAGCFESGSRDLRFRSIQAATTAGLFNTSVHQRRHHQSARRQHYKAESATRAGDAAGGEWCEQEGVLLPVETTGPAADAIAATLAHHDPIEDDVRRPLLRPTPPKTRMRSLVKSTHNSPDGQAHSRQPR